MVKIIHIKMHSLTHLILQIGYPIYSRNGSSMLRTPLHGTTLYAESFTVTACRLWNSLPFPLRSIQNRVRFVASLKSECLRWVRFMELMRERERVAGGLNGQVYMLGRNYKIFCSLFLVLFISKRIFLFFSYNLFSFVLLILYSFIVLQYSFLIFNNAGTIVCNIVKFVSKKYINQYINQSIKLN